MGMGCQGAVMDRRLVVNAVDHRSSHHIAGSCDLKFHYRRRYKQSDPFLGPCSSRKGETSGVVCFGAATHAPPAPPPPPILSNGVVDYYELLGVDDDASSGEIKMAYRNLAKECHPDFLGDQGHNICVLLNEAYDVLMDSDTRYVYNQQLQSALVDALDDYTGNPYSKWLVGHKMGRNADPYEDRALFVDEPACVGCKQCVFLAPAVFRMESQYGRSRVFAQWASSEDDIQDAIDSCPVDCIHWVNKEQLPALEYVTRFRSKRNSVANMMSGMGANADVFAAATKFLKARQRKEEARQRSEKRRSAEQERIRKRAAIDLMKKRGGWMANFYENLEQAMAGVAHNVESSMDDGYTEAPQVGFRKRHVPGSALDDETGATIPPERSLVLVPKN